MEIRILNNTFILLPQKALLWKEERALLISDLHIGKIAHFRKAGIAIPARGGEDNFRRLDELMDLRPLRVLFIGDLFHSDVNKEWDALCEWRKRHSRVGMHIVPGNHDRLPARFCEDFGIDVHTDELHQGPFIFSHHPRKARNESEYLISGHVHPVINLYGRAHQQLRFPCFYFGHQQAILPSFGYFTGGYAIEPENGDQVVAIVKEQLISIPAF
jgi:uncharacterized protein